MMVTLSLRASAGHQEFNDEQSVRKEKSTGVSIKIASPTQYAVNRTHKTEFGTFSADEQLNSLGVSKQLSRM